MKHPFAYRRSILPAVSVATLLSVCYVPAGAESPFCRSSEQLIWSCHAGQKQYAVCASKVLDGSTGYLQYRVMKRGKMEFEYPSPPTHPRGLFRLIVGPRATGLLFANGGYEYEINESLEGRAVIEVSKDQKSIASITCTTASDTLTLTTTQRFLKEIGLSE